MKRLLFLAVVFTGCGDDVAVADTETDGGTSQSDSNARTEPSTSDSETDASGCGALEISCVNPESFECTGPQTPFDLQPPDLSCSDWMLEDEAPAAFPVGTTDVVFTATDGGEAATCTAVVTVTDTVTPAITCPAPTTVLRAQEGESVAVPSVEASDVCDEVPTVSFSPMTLNTSGLVSYEARDASGNSASCQTEYTVLDAFAVPGFRIISARAEAADTVVTLAWEPPESEAVDGLRLESANAVDGPWSEVSTLPVGQQLHEETLSQDAAFFRIVSTTAFGDGGVTAARRAFRIDADGYDVDDVDVPNVPFDTTLYGVV
ncbi:MAG: hypothetical protein KUG77_07460, partial [Nannocystaceae bacterium]|nr:hypothetical protein [Nannocystaceae bacterium]